MTWMQTYTGRAFDIEGGPECDDQIHLDDIAMALGNTCRYNGHCRGFYSVAEHSVHVYRRVSDQTASPAIQMLALLHDAHEAYTGDVTAPIKRLPWMKEYRLWCGRVQERIHRALGVNNLIARELSTISIPDAFAMVKRADMELLATEAEVFMEDPPRPWVEMPEPLDIDIWCTEPGNAAMVFSVAFHNLKNYAEEYHAQNHTA